MWDTASKNYVTVSCSGLLPAHYGFKERGINSDEALLGIVMSARLGRHSYHLICAAEAVNVVRCVGCAHEHLTALHHHCKLNGDGLCSFIGHVNIGPRNGAYGWATYRIDASGHGRSNMTSCEKEMSA